MAILLIELHSPLSSPTTTSSTASSLYEDSGVSTSGASETEYDSNDDDISSSDDARYSVKTEHSEKKTSSKTCSLSNTDFKKWKYLFPTTLWDTIQNTDDKCICNNFSGNHARCKHVVKAEGRVVDVEKILRLLERFRQRKNYNGLFGEIKHLIEAVICGNNHKSPAMDILAGLEGLGIKSSETNRQQINPYLSWLEDSLRSKAPAVKSETKPITPQEIPATTHVPSVPLSPEFQTFQPQKYKEVSASTALYIEIVKPLNTSEVAGGYIYIFSEVGKIGNIKIGHTINLDKRLERWNSNCKRQFEYHEATKDGQLDWIPHEARVEKLIFTELKDYRKRKWCGSCSQNHIEWFDVDPEHVVKVFEKWRRWVLQEPYVQDEITRKWGPRVVPAVCKPIPFS